MFPEQARKSMMFCFNTGNFNTTLEDIIVNYWIIFLGSCLRIFFYSHYMMSLWPLIALTRWGFGRRRQSQYHHLHKEFVSDAAQMSWGSWEMGDGDIALKYGGRGYFLSYSMYCCLLQELLGRLCKVSSPRTIFESELQ